MSPRQSLLLALAFLLSPEPSPAGPPDDGRRPPVFSTEVSIVSVPVFVVDKSGRAVRGLSAEDFQLLDDGKPMRVVSFQYVDTTSPEVQEEIWQAPAARRHILFLFDLSFTEPQGLNRAQAAARDIVRRGLALSDLAAVATFDTSRGVRLVANFTEDRALLAHAIETLGAPSLVRISDPLSLAISVQASEVQRSSSRRIGEDASVVSDQFIAAFARRLRRAEEQLYRAQVLSLVEGLQELGRSLRGVEGRKQILYFSAGFDAQALVGNTSNSDLIEAAEAVVQGRLFDVDNEARFGESRLRDLVSAMTRTLSSSDCVVHAVDVTGLGTEADPAQSTVSKDPGRDTSGRESLNFMAAETGGRFFKDTNDLRTALDEVLEMTSRYYILGYQPEDLKGPGRFHKLKVKVHRKSSKVSHRAGFHERVPMASQTFLQRKFEAAQLVMTGAGANDLRFSSLCLPFPEGREQTLGVVLQIPKEELRWQGPMDLEIYAYAVAADGSVKNHLAQFAQIDPSKADPAQVARGVSFYGSLRVPAGVYTLRLMVVEQGTGSSGVQFFDVTVPPPDPRVGFLLPPVLVDDPRRWVMLNMGSEQPGRPGFPFAMGGQSFLPRTSFRVEPGTPEKLVLFAYEPERPSDPVAGIEIRSTVTDASGNLVPAGPLRIERIHRDGGSRRTYVLGYTPEGLAPGEYTLRIGVAEAGSRLESYTLLRVGPARSSGPR